MTGLLLPVSSSGSPNSLASPVAVEDDITYDKESSPSELVEKWLKQLTYLHLQRIDTYCMFPRAQRKRAAPNTHNVRR